MKIILFFSLIILVYTFAGYPFLLLVLSRFARWDLKTKEALPRVSVLVVAYNEEQVIEKRIRNLLDVDYEKHLIEIIVASDGSNDRTVELAKMYQNVRVFDFPRQGRSLTHNMAMEHIESPIVIFTDSGTEFDRMFIKNITRYFSFQKTGCVVGNLHYLTDKSSISEFEGLYFKAEKKIRQLESKLGILTAGTGACMAVKRELWKDLPPTFDTDTATPLDVIKQGYRVVYAPDAIAYDVPPSSILGELKARIRQVSKAFNGIFKHWGWSDRIRHPLVSWGLLSHKILRWLTPFFMIGAFLSSIFLLDEGLIYRIAFLAQITFYILALVGLGGELLKIKIPVVFSIFSFCIANIGMGLGVIRGIIGIAPATYKTTE